MSGLGAITSGEKKVAIYTSAVFTNYLEADNIKANTFEVGTIIASDVSYTNFSADNIYANAIFTSDITAGAGFFGDLTVDNLTANNLNFTSVTINNLAVSDIAVGNIVSNEIRTSDLYFGLAIGDRMAITNTLQANQVDTFILNSWHTRTSDIHSGDIYNSEQLYTYNLMVSDTAYINNLEVLNMNVISTLQTDHLIVDIDLEAPTADINILTVIDGEILDLASETINVSDARVGVLTAGSINVSDMATNNLTANTLLITSDAVVQRLTIPDNIILNTGSFNTLNGQTLNVSDSSIGYLVVGRINVSDITANMGFINGIKSSDIVTGDILINNNLRFKNIDNTTTTTLSSNNTNNRFFQLPTLTAVVSDTLVTEQGVNTMTNKTITDLSNNVSARRLNSLSGTVLVNSTDPIAGYVLTATSPTNATWQAPATGSSVVNSSDIINKVGFANQLELTTPLELVVGTYGSNSTVSRIRTDNHGRLQYCSDVSILINGNINIQSATITGDRLVNGAVDNTKLAIGSVNSSTIQDGSITNTDILDNTITSLKLSATGVTAGVYGSSTLIPVIDCDSKGRITALSQVAVSGGGAVVLDSSDIQNDLANPGRLKLTPTSIVAASYGTATQVPTINVGVGGKLNSVSNTTILINGSSQIITGSITGNKMVNSTITSTQLAANAVVNATITNGSITGPKIAADTITGANIAAGAITNLLLQNNTVTSAKMSNTGVVAGTYLFSALTSITIDAAGRVTSIV